jgi:membrane-associated protease RseP (regulator of RpoE activity)
MTIPAPVEIESVESGSLAEQAGIKAGDRLVSINRKRVRDVIDLMVYGSDPELRIVVQRGPERISYLLHRERIGRHHWGSGSNRCGCAPAEQMSFLFCPSVAQRTEETALPQG